MHVGAGLRPSSRCGFVRVRSPWSVSMLKSRASPTGYNPPQPPLTWRQHVWSALVVVLLIAAVLLIADLLQRLGVTSDLAYGLPAFGFAAWCVAWTTLVHNATIKTRGTVWARHVLIGSAVIAAVAAVAGCWNRGPSISGLL